MLISMNIGAYYEYLKLKVKIFLELLEKKCNLIYVNKYKVIIMKSFTIILSFFLCFMLVADDHKDKKETMKDKFMNNPNYLLDFKTCKEVKDGIFGLLSLGDSVWKEIELNPEKEEKWLEVSVLADMAANYSTIYDVWCKDMINHRMKMRMMSEKKKGKKEKEDN